MGPRIYGPAGLRRYGPCGLIRVVWGIWGGIIIMITIGTMINLSRLPASRALVADVLKQAAFTPPMLVKSSAPVDAANHLVSYYPGGFCPSEGSASAMMKMLCATGLWRQGRE